MKKVKIDYHHCRGRIYAEVKRAARCWMPILGSARKNQLRWEEIKGYFPSGIPAVHPVAGSASGGTFALTSVVFSHVAEGSQVFAVKAYVWFINNAAGEKSAHICIAPERVEHVIEVVHQRRFFDERWAALVFTSYGEGAVITSNLPVKAGDPVNSLAIGEEDAFTQVKKYPKAFNAFRVWTEFAPEGLRLGVNDFSYMRRCLEFDAERKPSRVGIEINNFTKYLQARQGMENTQPAVASRDSFRALHCVNC